MHFKNENEMNSNTNHLQGATGTASTRSCTSSTDSGVIIIDNNKTTFCKSNEDNSVDNDAETRSTTGKDSENNNDESLNNYKNILKNKSDTNNINIVENQINIKTNNHKKSNESLNNDRRQSHKNNNTDNTKNDSATNTPTFATKNYSPTVSIRSTTISIVSIDENAIDSSVVDSDSDGEADAEGVHSNYVVKKLGQHTTYAPDSPDLPTINKGLKVISQRISPGDGSCLPTAPGPLAQQILNGSLPGGGLVPPPSAPQIGSIALSNSSDVTFGDKHFYEGPVTIHQFLIDSRDKWKPTDEEAQDNPMFKPEHETAEQSPTSKTNSPPLQPEPATYRFLFKRKALIITGTIVLLTLVLVTGYAVLSNYYKSTISKSKLLGDGDDSRKNIPINSTIGMDNVGGGMVLRTVARSSWLAQPPSNALVPLTLPVHRVIIISTRTEDCTYQAACTFRVRFIQTFNIESQTQDDIIYNFLIGGDGNVYEGRGWDFKGAHLPGFNDDSVSFAYIGTFNQQKPNDKQMNVTKLLLAEGLRLGKLSENYKLIGAHELDPTSTVTKADALYESFKDWPHWSENNIKT